MLFLSGASLWLLWAVVIVIFLVIESMTVGLQAIWYAVGALAALIAAMVGAPLWLQLVWFVLVSIAALALTRPLARKYVNGRVTPTNADRILGRECVVRETIDNLRGTGAVAVDGKVWTARMLKENETAREGETVIARRIDGVKLIVEKV